MKNALYRCIGLAVVVVFFVNCQVFGTVQYTVTGLNTLMVGLNSEALGINNSGQVVGWVYEHPFLYSNGTMQVLGANTGHSGSAKGINASGQVVGYFPFSAWQYMPFFTPTGYARPRYPRQY